MSDPQNRLFVYGTLLAVADHPLGARLRSAGQRIAAGSIQARLYVITEVDALGENRYPGAVPSGTAGDRVFGEVWDIEDPSIWPEFDAYEACTADWPEPHEFLLRSVPVETDDGVIWARSYLYAWDTSRAEPVPSGRFDLRMPDAR